MPPGLGAAARWLSIASALILSACASVGRRWIWLIARRPSSNAAAICVARAVPTPLVSASSRGDARDSGAMRSESSAAFAICV